MTSFRAQLDAAVAEALGHFGAGRLDAASAIGREILALQPRMAETLHLMGAIALRRGQPDEAIERVERAVALDGRVATYHNTLGEAHRAKGDGPRALACYERALAIDPGFPYAHGNIRQLQGDGVPSTLDQCRSRVEAAPEDAVAVTDLANAVAGTGDAEAAALYRKVLRLDPTSLAAYCNLGLALADLGRLDEAIGCCLTALALQPASADAHNNLGLALLAKGDYAAAWPHHEYRPQTWSGRFRTQPWRGEPLDGRRILLHAEQGFGDTLQFVRYAPLVAARGGRVVLEVQPALRRLLAGFPGVEEVITAETRAAGVAAHCPLMSLPLAFGTMLASVPAAVPYIAAPDELALPWRERLAAVDGVKVGIVWRGQAQHRRDRDRSLPPALLAPLAEVTGVQFFALQKTPSGSGFADLPAALRKDGRTIDLAADLGDYADTAAAVAALDLVVTVDTSIAHLAGALGKPVWVLLPRVADWRWGRHGSHAPWYPNARLFRQERAEEWVPVVANVARMLLALAAR